MDSVGLTYERAKDLSAYMLPQPWNININSNSIGINVSGLAYSNRFPNLEGQFDAYPELIHRLINHFRQKDVLSILFLILIIVLNLMKIMTTWLHAAWHMIVLKIRQMLFL